MKKLIILILVVGVIGGLVWVLPKIRLGNFFLDGKDGTVERGNLVIPVSASGFVQADQQIEIKSKASGEVKEVRVKAGQMVKTGDVLLVLDKVDETRNLERAQADLDRANAGHQQALIRLDENRKNRPLDVRVAEELMNQAHEQMISLDIDVNRLKNMTGDAKGPVEEQKAQAALNSAKALWEKSKVDLERTKNNVPIAITNAEQDVALAKAVRDVSQKQVDEAAERLKETTIVSPTTGMIYSIKVAKGQLVQSGKTSLTGGTPLMYISDVSRIYVMAQVDEADIGAVQKISPVFARPGSVREVSDQELIESAPLPPVDYLLEGGESPASQVVTPAAARAAEQLTDELGKRRVRVTVEAYRDEEYEGIIERIEPEPITLSNVTTFNVRIRLVPRESQDLAKLLSKQADVNFTADRKVNVLRVRNEALASEGKEVFVYVPYRESPKEPEFEKKVPVRIGLTDGTYTEILSGLKEKERIWVKRPQRTDAEKKKQNQSA